MKFLKQTTYILVLILTLSALDAVAQTRQTREEYIDKYKHIAIEHMERYGIPASITLAQGILESDSGNSNLARRSNNHFGIKCKSNWTGQRVYHTDDAPDECFRKYDSVEESYEDHAEFLGQSPRYASLFAYSSSDYRSWARGLKAAGYATALPLPFCRVDFPYEPDIFQCRNPHPSLLIWLKKTGSASLQHTG